MAYFWAIIAWIYETIPMERRFCKSSMASQLWDHLDQETFFKHGPLSSTTRAIATRLDTQHVDLMKINELFCSCFLSTSIILCLMTENWKLYFILVSYWITIRLPFYSTTCFYLGMLFPSFKVNGLNGFSSFGSKERY